jgi:hypothetical protein
MMPTPPIAPHFSAGYDSGRDPSLSPGLEQQSARWTEAAMAAATAPQSVLQQLAPSPIAANVSAPSASGRLLRNGWVLPNYSNGASQNTAETENFLRNDVAE